jgi:hypothetical protein
MGRYGIGSYMYAAGTASRFRRFSRIRRALIIHYIDKMIDGEAT